MLSIQRIGLIGLLTVCFASVAAADPVTITLTTNVLVQDVRRGGMDISDEYYGSAIMKKQWSRNFEGTMYRVVQSGQLFTNRYIFDAGLVPLPIEPVWAEGFTNGCTYEVLNGADSGSTGMFLSTAVTTVDVYENGELFERLQLELDQTLSAGPARDIELRVDATNGVDVLIYRGILSGTLYTALRTLEPVEKAVGWWDTVLGNSNTVFQILSGEAQGATGSVIRVYSTHYDKHQSGTTNEHIVLEFAPPVSLSDTSGIRGTGFFVENPAGVEEGYLGDPTTSHNGPGVTLVDDNPPGLFGEHSARMDGTSETSKLKIKSAGNHWRDINGTWTFEFRARCESGTPQVEVEMIRYGATNFILVDTNWLHYSFQLDISGETDLEKSATGRINVDGGVLRVDNVAMWHAGDTNDTSFIDNFLHGMKKLNPGSLRQVDMGGSSIENWIYPSEQQYGGTFAMYISTPGPYEGSALRKNKTGLHDMLELGEAVGCDTWLCIPGTVRPSEMTGFMEYLGGPTNTPMGQLRAALGHPEPWTTSFSNAGNRILVEMGNEAWNTAWSYLGGGFNGPDFWSNCFATAKSSPCYSDTIQMVAGGRNGATTTDTILGDHPNADLYAIAPYMLHDVTTNIWIFGEDDFESQFEFFMAYPLYEIRDETAFQATVDRAEEAGVEVCTYEYNYHMKDIEGFSAVETTNVGRQLNIFLDSVCHGLSICNTMLMMQRDYGIRTQNSHKMGGLDHNPANTSGSLWEQVYTLRPDMERVKPSFYAQTMANKALFGDMLETEHSVNEPMLAAAGAFEKDGIVVTNSYPTLYSYSIRNGTTNALILFNYDLTQTQTVEVLFNEYVKDDQADVWKLETSSYTNNNRWGTDPTTVPVVESNITFSSGAAIDLQPASMRVYLWESDGLFPELVVSTSAVTLAEGSSTNFTLSLSSQPKDPTTVTVARVFSQNSDITATPSSHVFTATTWSDAWTVILQAAEEDMNYIAGSALIRCSSPGMASHDITVTEIEDDIDPVFLLPFTETFDPGAEEMADMPGDLHGQHGWAVSGSGTAIVQSDDVYSGAQSLDLTASTASHSFSNGSDRVEITLYVRPVTGPEQISLEGNSWSAVFYINSNLHVVAYSNTVPLEITSETASNDWNRLDIVCDYTAQTWSLELNGTSLFTHFAFHSPRPNFSRFAVRDVVNSTTSRIDSISITGFDPNGDDDADGLPNGWEQQYFGGPTNAVASVDSDLDGLTNLEEYIAGTDPVAAGSVFQITDLSINGPAIVQWNTVSGRLYNVYWTSNLLNGFQTLETNLPWTQSTFTDGVYGAEQQGFYQIKVEKQ